MHIRELTIINYTEFIRRFSTLDNNHRYVKYFFRKFIGEPPENISDDDKAIVEQKLKITLNRIKAMTNEEFSSSPCANKFCILFHDTGEWVKIEHPLMGGYKIANHDDVNLADRGIRFKLHRLVNGQWVDIGYVEE